MAKARSTSRPTSAKQAAEAARAFLHAAGLGLSIVISVKEEASFYDVTAESLGRHFRMRVHKATGDVGDFREVDAPKA